MKVPSDALPSMRVYTCKKCNSVFIVSELDPEIRLLQKSMRCPNAEQCGGRIKVYATTNIRMARSQKVAALQLYQATLGVGLPHEKKCSPKDLRQLLLGATVADVQLEPSPDPQRSLISSLTLSSGKVLHFSSSTKGAIIFKVTEGTHGR